MKLCIHQVYRLEKPKKNCQKKKKQNKQKLKIYDRFYPRLFQLCLDSMILKLVN